MSGRESELQRVWLEQLLAEHQQISLLHGLRLSAPVFEISDDMNLAGAWTGGFAGLKMAGWLIRNHGWDVVLEVLRHEMAHQYVHEVMGRGHEKSHGAAFQEACQRLGVHPLFCRAGGSLPHLLQGERGRGRVLPAKVEKLLALAQSSNEHEAALAMEKANGLLRRYNISRIEEKVISRYDYLIINEGKKRISAVQRGIAALLKDFFYVKVIVCRQFDAASGQTFRVLELIGAEENLAVAEHVYSFLRQRLTVLWQTYRCRRAAPARQRRSYQLGVLSGVRKRLLRRAVASSPESASAPLATTTCALVCSRDKGLMSYYRQRHPRLSRRCHRGPGLHGGSFLAGREEGGKLLIHRAVVSRSRQRGRLLSS